MMKNALIIMPILIVFFLSKDVHAQTSQAERQAYQMLVGQCYNYKKYSSGYVTGTSYYNHHFCSNGVIYFHEYSEVDCLECPRPSRKNKLHSYGTWTVGKLPNSNGIGVKVRLSSGEMVYYPIYYDERGYLYLQGEKRIYYSGYQAMCNF